jgi:selenophosphate synthase
VLGKLARQHDPNVLVGFDHADDAGVYQLTPDQALVQTVDFFTPIVDDPYTFGQIAATNALSDIYAMGGRPLTALALVCFPDKADLEILERILSGGLSKMIEANCTIIGGHSIRDEETKFGYSVTGLIHPKKVYANQGAKPGDALILTKALGTGVISTAIKKAKAMQPWIDAAVQSMTTLNKQAAEIITARVGADAFVRPQSAARVDAGHVKRAAPERKEASTDHQNNRARAALQGRDSVAPKTGASAPVPETGFQVHAMTDITGFGLIGHLREMLLASEVSAQISAATIPILPGALDCIRAGHIPGGLTNNRDFAECVVAYDHHIPEEMKSLLYDPQTAGGLLISTPEGATLMQSLQAAAIPAARIGKVLPRTKLLISITN